MTELKIPFEVLNIKQPKLFFKFKLNKVSTET